MELIKNLKETSIIKNLFIAICGTIILAVSAKVKIPFYPVPMTMQTEIRSFYGFTLFNSRYSWFTCFCWNA